jgi:hypothetical protein
MADPDPFVTLGEEGACSGSWICCSSLICSGALLCRLGDNFSSVALEVNEYARAQWSDQARRDLVHMPWEEPYARTPNIATDRYDRHRCC